MHSRFMKLITEFVKEVISTEFWVRLVRHPAFFLTLVICLLLHEIAYQLTKELLTFVWPK